MAFFIHKGWWGTLPLFAPIVDIVYSPFLTPLAWILETSLVKDGIYNAVNNPLRAIYGNFIRSYPVTSYD